MGCGLTITTTAALEERLTLATDNSLIFSDPMLDICKTVTSPDINKMTSLSVSPEAMTSNAANLDLRLPPSPPLPTGTEVPVMLREEL
jgi:hypothetical protein